MLRHIVMFQFKEENKAENVAKTKAMLDALPAKIDWIRASATAVNCPGIDETNYDLVLIADFDSAEDLQRYKVHPAHVAVGDFMRPVRLARVCVDFTL